MGNFALNDILSVDTNTPLGGAFISNLLVTPANFLDPGASAVNRTIDEAVRRVEVGGIVFNHGVDLVQIDQAAPGQQAVLFQQLLTVNHLDTGQAPIGIDFPWSSNQQPVSFTGTTTTENTDEPVRILYRSAGTIATTDFDSTAGAQVPVFHFQRSKNMRLKLPVGAQQAICWTSHMNYISAGGATDIVAVRVWICGTIYYRYRF